MIWIMFSFTESVNSISVNICLNACPVTTNIMHYIKSLYMLAIQSYQVWTQSGQNLQTNLQLLPPPFFLLLLLLHFPASQWQIKVAETGVNMLAQMNLSSWKVCKVSLWQLSNLSAIVLSFFSQTAKLASKRKTDYCMESSLISMSKIHTHTHMRKKEEEEEKKEALTLNCKTRKRMWCNSLKCTRLEKSSHNLQFMFPTHLWFVKVIVIKPDITHW